MKDEQTIIFKFINKTLFYHKLQLSSLILTGGPDGPSFPFGPWLPSVPGIPGGPGKPEVEIKIVRNIFENLTSFEKKLELEF